MKNIYLTYEIKINEGQFKDQIVILNTDIEELEEGSLSEILLDNNFLDVWCNNNEYTIISREIHNDFCGYDCKLKNEE